MNEKLKLKDSIYILKESKDIYQVIFTGTRKVKRFNVDSLVKKTIEELKKEKTESEIINKLSKRYSNKDIHSCIKSLESFGIITKYSDISNKRYIKQIYFIEELTNSWDETLRLQNKIENSNISVFGVGGIGTWIINGLSQIGINNIKITDPDIVKESNLNRQLLFNSSDIGKYKVDVIKDKLPDVNIETFKKRVNKKENLDDIIQGADFLINCTDEPSVVETTKIIDNYARKYEIPYCVAGGYNMHLGMIGPIIVPGKTKSFEDFINYQKSMDPLKDFEKIKDIGDTGSLGPIAGAVANIQIMEIFKYFIGKGDLNLNKFAEINFMNFNIEWKKY